MDKDPKKTVNKTKDGPRITSNISVTNLLGNEKSSVGKGVVVKRSSAGKQVGTGPGREGLGALPMVPTTQKAKKELGRKTPVVELNDIGNMGQGEATSGLEDSEADSVASARLRKQSLRKRSSLVKSPVESETDSSDESDSREECGAADCTIRENLDQGKDIGEQDEVVRMGRAFRESVKKLRLLLHDYSRKRGDVRKARVMNGVENLLDLGNNIIDSNNLLRGELRALRTSNEETNTAMVGSIRQVVGKLDNIEMATKKIEQVEIIKKNVQQVKDSIRGTGVDPRKNQMMGGGTPLYSQMVTSRAGIENRVAAATKPKHEVIVKGKGQETIDTEKKLNIMRELGIRDGININRATLLKSGSLRIKVQKKEDLEKVKGTLSAGGATPGQPSWS